MPKRNAPKPFSKLAPAKKFYKRWTDLVLKDPEYGMQWKPLTEQRFCERRWRFDYSWPISKVVVEIDGFGFGHQSQQAIMNQNEKRNRALMLGWRVLVFDSRTLGAKERVDASVWMTVEAIVTFFPGSRGDIQNN